MPLTVRVRASLATHLLAIGDEGLRRRIGILRDMPFPPGSRSLAADEDWQSWAAEFRGRRAFVYGSFDNAVVYTYDSSTETLLVEFGVTAGQVVGRAH
jgi:hypothetical protein